MKSNWTLVTVTYNSAETLRRFWQHEKPAQVRWIVVDNASHDSTAEVAAQLGAEVLSMPTNRGFSTANNVGLSNCNSEYVAFVNPDVKVDYSSLDNIAELIDISDGIVAPQLINEDDTPQPNGRGIPSIAAKINNRINFSESLASGYTIYASETEIKNVLWLMGAAVCGKRQQFEGLSGWNENYFLYYEDKDLSMRAHLAGHPVLLDGGSKWAHGWARETSKFRLRPWYFELRSAAQFYKSYPEYILQSFAGRSRRFREAIRLSGTGWGNHAEFRGQK